MQNDKMEDELLDWVSITVESSAWEDILPETKKTLSTCLNAVLGLFPLYKGSMELSIVLGDDALIQPLNRQYRQKDNPTNVLSFPLEHLNKGTVLPDFVPFLLGDMIFSFDTIFQESQEQKIALQHHVAHLCVHSFLHLLGYDHISEEDAYEMEDLEIKILGKLGIRNPYKVKE